MRHKVPFASPTTTRRAVTTNNASRATIPESDDRGADDTDEGILRTAFR